MELKDLLLKNKVLWSKTVRRLAPVHTKELRQENLQKVASFQTAKGLKVLSRLRPRTRFARTLGLPEHDCAKLVYSNGRRNCTQAPLKGQPPLKLRLGMLSAKLKAKFGHLCTET